MIQSDGTHLGFVGVSTAGSSIMNVFPRWADLLGLDTRRIVGYDLPVDASASQYRELVLRLYEDEDCVGALVTTHKVGVFEAAHDLFDDLDPLARRFREISCISRRNGRLEGAAKDPVTARLALDDFLAAEYFDGSQAAAFCLGAGGAGSAITYCLASREHRPCGITCTDIDDARLHELRRLHRASGFDPELFDYVRVESDDDVARLVAGAGEGSLIVNATGMGKDRPGSPLPAATVFPPRGVIWDLNYRGTLEFLAHAREQASERKLTIVDGWRYFIHGWTQVIATVFELELSNDQVERLATAAAE